MATNLMTPHEKVVVKVLFPVHMLESRSEVEALPVGAVELPLELDRVVVVPDPLVAREVLEGLDAGVDLSYGLDHEGLLTQEAEDCIDDIGGNPVLDDAQHISQHLEIQ